MERFGIGELTAENAKFAKKISETFVVFVPSERQDKPGRSNILKGGYLVNCPFDK
jgi:hypothetical protein